MQSEAATNEEISDAFAVARYMEKRGNSKRHTLALGSVDEVEKLQTTSGSQQSSSSSTPSSSSRTRRTGLLTVMERPPG